MFQLVPRQWTGSFGGGFMFFAVLAIAVLLALRRVQRGWVGACIGPNGRVITPASVYYRSPLWPTFLLNSRLAGWKSALTSG